ncbi:Protein CBG13172 [Caenorhabditis briggsae]|nr:Protein CBG13172 [Caenorhabditis briggsae]ULU00197.1 hypothetical protein L3Y34_001010 [Caenorhabditis briggsae]UMM22876.1 hypothetical protein L5515_003863 [Caenorhabditis briggsae]CAP32004.1 Protein CBG13172 [Caenorhabditis briggsae]
MSRRYLVLNFNSVSNIASCYKKEDFQLIRVKIDSNDAGFSRRPLPGKFLVFDMKYSKLENGIYTNPYIKVEDPMPEDCISTEADGTFKISSYIAFSPDSRHKTFERKLAFADWYGFVDSSEVKTNQKMNAFRSFIVVKDLDYEQNKSQLFKVTKIKGPIDPYKQQKDYNDYIDLTRKLELAENQLLEEREKPQRPARNVDGKKAADKNRNYDMRGSIDVARHLQNAQISTSNLVNTPVLQQIDMRPPLPAALLQPTNMYTDPLPQLTPYCLRDQALIVSQESEDVYIVWLTQIREAAILQTSEVGMVHLGASYECNYSTATNLRDVRHKITNIEKSLQSLPFQIILHEELAVARILVDLCTPNTKCHKWSFYMGIPFFNSSDVGIVTMADIIDTPTKTGVKWQDALRIYLGEDSAKNMICICRLEKQKLPLNLDDPFLNDDDFSSISKYSWQVLAICSTEESDRFNEDQLRKKNLGKDKEALEEDDDIARIKRENKKVKFGENHFRYFAVDSSPSQPSSSSNPFYN